MTPSKYQAVTLTLLRIVAAGIYMQHGVQKVMSFQQHGSLGGPLQYTAMFLETVFAALIILGLFTRIAAFICSGEMAVAYFLFHAPHGFFPVNNHGETPALLCFIFFYLSAVGGGPFSLDAVFRRNATG
ncbi:MAG TPA: DoxX family protein [Gemmatimonadaceae bacterium]|nr:DoxX family protein [Gemmatimonadaceae bacterium]